MRRTWFLLTAVLVFALAGSAYGDDYSSQSGSASATQYGSTAASALNAAAASANQQQGQGQQQSQQNIIYNNNANTLNYGSYGNAQGQSTSNNAGNTVNVANNAPTVTVDSNSPSIWYPDQPTIYPGFAANPPADLPFMRHHDITRAWNTAPSLFDMALTWDYSQIGAFDKKVAVDGKAFGRGEAIYNNVQVYVTKDEALKTPGKNVRFLFAGSTHGDIEGVSILDCEMAALAKAKELGGNGIIVKIEGFTVASKTKGKSIGVGASGTWLERFGNMAVGLPINFAYASALGDGYAKPFVCFYVVEVK